MSKKCTETNMAGLWSARRTRRVSFGEAQDKVLGESLMRTLSLIVSFKGHLWKVCSRHCFNLLFIKVILHTIFKKSLGLFGSDWPWKSHSSQHTVIPKSSNAFFSLLLRTSEEPSVMTTLASIYYESDVPDSNSRPHTQHFLQSWQEFLCGHHMCQCSQSLNVIP